MQQNILSTPYSVKLKIEDLYDFYVAYTVDLQAHGSVYFNIGFPSTAPLHTHFLQHGVWWGGM